MAAICSFHCRERASKNDFPSDDDDEEEEEDAVVAAGPDEEEGVPEDGEDDAAPTPVAVLTLAGSCPLRPELELELPAARLSA